MIESAETPVAAPAPTSTPERLDVSSYWDANLRLISRLLAIWLTVTYLPILIVRQLNQVGFLTGFPLGYYMGAQGSLLVFVVLIFYYARRMEQLDRQYGLDGE